MKKINFNIDQLDIDNENEFSLSKQLHKSKSMKLEYMENAHFVDLGLPSGTKWCKYNLGCDFALLSSRPESTSPKNWYGNYYSWGEIKHKDEHSLPKDEYSWDLYKYAKNSRYALTKYCTDSDYGYNGFTDSLTELLPEDDVAYKANSSWRMPTKELCQELIDYTNNKWISGKGNDLYMNVEDLAGRLFTSKINVNQLFIPAAGYMNVGNGGSYCDLWSSSLNVDNPRYAWGLYFDSDYISMSYNDRCYGQSVHAVMK